MITTEEAKANTGREVIYTWTREHGIITSANDKLIFVRYFGDHSSKATLTRDLEWASPHA